MALFSVYAYLTFTPAQSEALAKSAEAQQRIATAMETLVAKFDESAIPPDLAAAASALGVSTEALRAALAHIQLP